jgi:hypothetical protein
MVPQGFAAPNLALNSTINRGNALTKKLALLGIFVTTLEINPVGPAGSEIPLNGIGITQAQAAGVGPDDLIHLLFQYIGGGDMQPEVAVIEQLIAPGTVSAVVALFDGLYPALSAVQAESRAITALANLPAVATALQSALA